MVLVKYTRYSAQLNRFVRVSRPTVAFVKKCRMIEERQLSAELEDFPFMSDWNLYDTLSEGKKNN